jgi:DNA-binding CsgD family transcriptional regulator
MLDTAPSPEKYPSNAREKIPREGPLTFTLGVVFLGMTVLGAVDVAFDFQEAISLKHQLVGVSEFIIGLLGVTATGRGLVSSLRRERMLRQEANTAAARWQRRESELETEAAKLAQQLESSKLEAQRWKHEAGELLTGLGGAIDVQFNRWMLTPAEREVALLLLKGLSHKEIASVRGVGEVTVRQQAQATYRKAGLSSRNDLAAFFLEDLLLPNRIANNDAPEM